jgi:uncharacterized protein YkwD
MARLGLLICLALAIVAAGFPDAASAAPRNAARSGENAASISISKLRAEQGLVPVRSDPVLTRAAREQADAMARAGTMSHDVVGSLQSRLARAGIRAGRAGENVAAGHTTLTEVLAAWMRSSGHRDNLLMRDATRIGLARSDGRGGPYWALVVASPEPSERRSEPSPAGNSRIFFGLPLPIRP